MHIVLYEPEIPPNTGNIIRLAANTGCQLHLIEPLGFRLDDKRLRRAGLDYHEWAKIALHESYPSFLKNCLFTNLCAFTTKAKNVYANDRFHPNDALLFGPETRGLPKELLDVLQNDQKLRIPMVANSRSLNLSNTVSVVVYEAWRKQNFEL